MALQICCPKPQLQRLMLKPVPGLMAAFLLGMTTFLPTLGTKMEMTVYDVYGDTFRGLEKQEGKSVEIFQVEVGHANSGFNAAKSPFRLTATSYTQVHIIDPLNNRLYFDFKSIHEIPHISNMDINYPIGMNSNY
ncbi:unnamed protein product [Brassica oleracea]|uniref:(rape) hypothetical protein n=1 Tax=Brassica napus TaxID=3708 RepID=A0A816RQR9_BRANA|nr:unnamed protein product [Brassica napus]